MKIVRIALSVLIVAGAFAVRLAAQVSVPASPLIRSDPSVPAGTLATVNGRPIGLEDLDPRLADAVLTLDATERAGRKQTLETAISLELFALEGRTRRLSASDVANQEVALRTKMPTTAEIGQVYQDHFAEFGGADLAAARPQIVAYLKQQQQQSILMAFAQRLRAKYPVTLPVDINSPSLTPNTVVAVIAGKPMLAGPLMEQFKSSIFGLRSQVYAAMRQSLDQLIYSRLVLDEARRRNVEPETIIRAEITERETPVADADVAKYYADNKSYFDEKKIDLETAKNSIVDQLQEQGRIRLEADLAIRLNKQHVVVEYLLAPEVPVLAISVGHGPSRGDVNAPVTVVMFTDFQCPACARTHPILQELLRQYGNRVHFVVRDFPLEMHPDSAKAAEAAAAADAQGKFFEYIEILYQHQDALGIAKLKEYATQIGLDRVKFDLALTRGTYSGLVQQDVEDGERYGIHATPAIFINGKLVTDIGPVGLQQALDAAFAAAGVPVGGKK